MGALFYAPGADMRTDILMGLSAVMAVDVVVFVMGICKRFQESSGGRLGLVERYMARGVGFSVI